jgi:hypothetical protein
MPSRSPRQYMPPFTCAHNRHSGSRPESSLLGRRHELDNSANIRERVESNYAGAAAIKDAPAEIPSAATLAALDNLGSPITAASVSARRRRTPRLRSFRSRADSKVGHLVERCRRRRLRVRASAQRMTAHPQRGQHRRGRVPRSTRQSRPATRRRQHRGDRDAEHAGQRMPAAAVVAWVGELGCGTARWSARGRGRMSGGRDGR